MAPRGNEWTGLASPAGFERCVRGSVRELYGYLALLTGRDRARTEQMVTDVYRSLFRAAAAGQLDAVRLGALRSAARRLWLERNDAELARPARLSPAPVKSIAELSVIERAVVVLRHVNGMSDERAGVELGRPADEVAAVAEHAIRRLRGTADTEGETTGAWLRVYFDSSVAPRPGLVDRIVAELGPSDDTPAPQAGVDEPTAPMPVVVEPNRPGDAGDADEPTAPLSIVTPHAPVEPPAGSTADPAVPDEVDDEDESAGDETDADESDADESDADESDADESDEPAVVPPPGEPSLADLASVGLTGAAIRPNVDGDDGVPTGEVPATSDGDVAWAPAPDDDSTRAATATTELPATPVAGARATTAADVEAVAHPPRPPATRRWWPVALVAVLALGLIALWWLFVREDDAGSVASDLSVPEEPGRASVDEGATSASDAGGTTASTVAATSPSISPSTSPSTTPSTTPSTAPGSPAAAAGPVLLDDETSGRFDPACAAWYAVPTPASPPLPATFGPLGSDPAVTVEIPIVTDGVGATIVEPAGDGLLLGVLQNDAEGTAAATVLARVGTDGVVHWVRCHDEALIVSGEPNADVVAAVGRFVDGQLGWYTLSMADGDISTEVDPVTGFALDVLYDRGPEAPTGATGATARWVDGELTGFDADGNVTWTDPDARTGAGDGFRLLVGDDLAIAYVCDDGTCETGRLRGYDLATGERRWERVGFAHAAAAADGHALIGSPTGWELVTATDGETVTGQTWADPLQFATPCCLESPTPFTERIGGLVVTARVGAVDLWLPADASDGTTLVDLTPPS